MDVRARHVLFKKKTPSYAFGGFSSSTTDASSYTFSSLNIGDASRDRVIVCYASVHDTGSGSPTITTLTINGVLAARVRAQSATTNYMACFVAVIPTGTSAEITFDTGGVTCERGGLAYWIFYGLQSTVPDHGTSTTADPASATLAIPDGGTAIAAGRVVGNETFTWTGLSEDFDGPIEAAFAFSGASLKPSEAQTVTVTADRSATGNTSFLWTVWR